MQNISGTLLFSQAPGIISYASVVGQKEGEGPLRDDFDRVIGDMYAGQKTFEQAESVLVREAVSAALSKGGVRPCDVDAAFAGDLLNQCVATSFGFKDFRFPYIGLYGACSTMALGLISSAVAVESKAARIAVSAASSHYCTAERQYRFPLEYGSQRPPTAQWTVTGAGACIVGEKNEEGLPRITAATVGIIKDLGITDQNNMGAAMAPAAADTIARYLRSTGEDIRSFDAIYTGDLGKIGSKLLHELLREQGIDIRHVHKDCGKLIFSENDDVHAGGSGCGCCASVLCGHILNRMRMGLEKNILFIATGALLSPTTTLQGETIPSIAHLVNIRI